MLIYIGENKIIRKKDIIGIFDLDSSTVSVQTRRFLSKAQKEKKVVTLGADLPKSFILTKQGIIYLSPFNTSVYKQ